MDGAFGRKQSRRGPTINITPLIDVMFLLLIFFMVSSTFRHNLGIDVDLPEADTATEQEMPSYEIIVTSAGEYHLGDSREPVSLREIQDFLTDLASKESNAAVVLQADPSADFEVVLDVFDTARKVAGTQNTGGMQLVIPTKLRSTEQNEHVVSDDSLRPDPGAQ